MAETPETNTGTNPEPQGGEATKGGNGQESNAQSEGQEPVTPALFDEPKDPDGDKAEEEGKEPDKGDDDAGKDGETPLTKDDVTVPEGFTYDEELGKSFLDVVNDTHLSRKDLVNKLVGMYAEQQGKMLAAIQAADTERAKQFDAEMAKEKTEWMCQCQADAEFGGQAWEASQAVIDRGCKQVATQGAVELLQRYNLNTHPEIVRMFYRAGKLAGEDRGAQGAGGGKTLNPAEAIFGESLKGLKKEEA